MRVAACAQIDNKTKKSIVATECSYNMACDYLDKQGLIPLLVSIEPGGLIRLKMQGKKTSRNFWYDEGRGYLLGE